MDDAELVLSRPRAYVCDMRAPVLVQSLYYYFFSVKSRDREPRLKFINTLQRQW